MKGFKEESTWSELPLGGFTLKATWKVGLKKYLTRSLENN